MHLKSHVDVPSLFRLLGCMKADNGGGAVKVDMVNHAWVGQPVRLHKSSPFKRAEEYARTLNTERVFAGL